MSDQDKKEVILGRASTILAPIGRKHVVTVCITICNKQVTPAPEGIYGLCNYYYEPLHEERVSCVRKHQPEFADPIESGVEKSGVSLGDYLSAHAKLASESQEGAPYQFFSEEDYQRRIQAEAQETIKQSITRRDQLIRPTSDQGWSRHGNFYARHIGCGHTPPEYYVNYGYYYCSRYTQYLLPRLSNKGKEWLVKSRRLLQVYLDAAIQQNMNPANKLIILKQLGKDRVFNIGYEELELDSALFKKVAFVTHVDAYMDAVLAELYADDLSRIGMMPNLEEWADPDTWEQATTVGKEVARRKAQVAADAVAKGVQESTETLVNKAETIQDAVRHVGSDIGSAFERALERLL